jgi:hypothetical protein
VNRVVHAQAAGARGFFEVTHDISDLTSAAFLSKVGTKTPALARISTVGGERGSSDTVRDVRGWAIKLFTTEGNQDWVFNHIVSDILHWYNQTDLTFVAGLLRQRSYKIPISKQVSQTASPNQSSRFNYVLGVGTTCHLKPRNSNVFLASTTTTKRVSTHSCTCSAIEEPLPLFVAPTHSADILISSRRR